ncbi:hypothetical protein KDK88_09940, partial [bacterium]|nr:hypothetical protein [bacterium]
WWAKASALEAYRDQLGIGVLAVTTSAPGGAFDQAMFDYAWYSALLCGYDAVGWGEDQFAASTGQAPLRAVPGVDPGAAFVSDVHVDGALYRRGTDAGWVTVDAAQHAGSFLAGPVAVPAVPGTEMLSAAPNPFNPVTEFAFTLERAGTVTMEIFAADGERVARPLRRAAFEPGRHGVQWSGAGLPSGPYFARLNVDGSIRTRRVMLVR